VILRAASTTPVTIIEFHILADFNDELLLLGAEELLPGSVNWMVMFL
jgi:hypothetical protein